MILIAFISKLVTDIIIIIHSGHDFNQLRGNRAKPRGLEKVSLLEPSLTFLWLMVGIRSGWSPVKVSTTSMALTYWFLVWSTVSKALVFLVKFSWSFCCSHVRIIVLTWIVLFRVAIPDHLWKFTCDFADQPLSHFGDTGMIVLQENITMYDHSIVR